MQGDDDSSRSQNDEMDMSATLQLACNFRHSFFFTLFLCALDCIKCQRKKQTNKQQTTRFPNSRYITGKNICFECRINLALKLFITQFTAQLQKHVSVILNKENKLISYLGLTRWVSDKLRQNKALLILPFQRQSTSLKFFIMHGKMEQACE